MLKKFCTHSYISLELVLCMNLVVSCSCKILLFSPLYSRSLSSSTNSSCFPWGFFSHLSLACLLFWPGHFWAGESFQPDWPVSVLGSYQLAKERERWWWFELDLKCEVTSDRSLLWKEMCGVMGSNRRREVAQPPADLSSESADYAASDDLYWGRSQLAVWMWL